MSFCVLIAYLSLVLNNITLSAFTTAYLSIHLRKGILGASKFGQLWISPLWISTGRFLCGHTLSTPLGKTKRSTIAELYGKSFIRNCQTVFQSGYNILNSQQQWMRASIAPHPTSIWYSQCFRFGLFQLGVSWYLTVVLICISLVTYNVVYFFICLFTY